MYQVLLQIQKQREDSAMLLASREQHKEITKTEKQNTRKRQQGRTKTKARRRSGHDLA
jgi:hypothetical protein